MSQTKPAMSDQALIQHIKQCRDLTRSFASRVFPIFWPAWCKQVVERAEKATSNKEQVALYEVRNLLAAVQDPAEQEFSQYLSNGFVKFKNKTLNTLTGEERFSGDMLSLVEHSDLEETIAITSISHRAENAFAESLWALQERLALLNGSSKLDARSNPASPVQFCEALRKVLSSLEVDVKTKIIGYKIFDQEIIEQLGRLYKELNQYLVDQDLLPDLRFAVSNNSAQQKSPVTESVENNVQESDLNQDSSEAAEESLNRRASDRLLNGSLSQNDVQYQNSLLNAIRLLQHHVTQPYADSMAAATTAEPIVASQYSMVGSVAGKASVAIHPASLHIYSNQQLVGVLDNMQAQASSATQKALDNSVESGNLVTFLAPQSAQSISQQMMQQIASENENGAVESKDMQTIDLVGMLFQYMLSDEHLPDSVKALLSYLHTPFLKIAFIDKDFFEQPEHPARVLLNSLAEAGIRWVSNDGSDQFDIFARIKATVFHLLEDFKSDVRLFAETLLEFNSYTHNVARRQELMERRTLEKAQGEEKLREAKMLVNRAVRTRTDGREMPSAILLLLLQPWSDYLSFLLLRYGVNSTSWIRAVNLIDDLLWSLEPKTLESDKAAQLDKQSEMISLLEQGFETIGYEQAKGRKLIDAVIALQKMALQSRKAEPAPAPMRTKLETMADEKAGSMGDSQQPLTPEESNIVDSLKMIEFGTWFEFEGGKRLKVAWFNKKTNHYMLVDQQGKKVSLVAGLQLARDMIAGKARIIAGSSKPFFERALENIYQTLNDRVSNLSAETPHE
ncbi:MAG TPA: DUF1631 family protein [Cellvibrio sp.]|nr:DUF1631 family protein [Cellvibrio sp.]